MQGCSAPSLEWMRFFSVSRVSLVNQCRTILKFQKNIAYCYNCLSRSELQILSFQSFRRSRWSQSSVICPVQLSLENSKTNATSIIPKQKAHNKNNEQNRPHPRTTICRIPNEGTERSITPTDYGNAIKKKIQRHIGSSIVVQPVPS